MGRRIGAAMAAGVALVACAGVASAAIPPDIAAKLREMGRQITPDATARLYRPLFGAGLPAGVTVQRDVAFGPDAKQVLNVYTPKAAARSPREVLVFLPGGQGLKQLAGPDNAPFYDNVGAWGVQHGLVVVIAQYRTGGGAPWDAGARDVASALTWVKANIAAKGGDPGRIVLFGQSNGATQLANYLGHPGLQTPGAKGAILMSGNFNLAPLKLKSPPAMLLLGAGPATPLPAPPPIDAAETLRRSNLEGLKASRIPLMLVSSQRDPEERVEVVQLTAGALAKARRRPVVVSIPGHNHVSEIESFGTADDSASGPVLKFIRSVK